jgi:hypothetical protein
MCDPSVRIVDSFYFGDEDEEHDDDDGDDDDDEHLTIRFAVKEVTKDDGMDAEMREATDVPASSAMHIEPSEVENVMKSRDSHHSPWSCL